MRSKDKIGNTADRVSRLKDHDMAKWMSVACLAACLGLMPFIDWWMPMCLLAASLLFFSPVAYRIVVNAKEPPA